MLRLLILRFAPVYSIALLIVPPLLMKEVTHSVAARVTFAVLWLFVGYPPLLWLFFLSRWSKRTLWKTAQPLEQQTAQSPEQQDVAAAISPQAQEHPTSPAPGWYPDPTGAPGARYWDGSRWNPTAQPPAQ